MRLYTDPPYSSYHDKYLDAVRPFNAADIEKSIIDRFSEQVNRCPQATAIESSKMRISYAELNALSDAIAFEITAHETSKDHLAPIALIFENTALLICAIIGVLKSGHPYLVLDAAYPEQRLSAMLEQSRASQILWQGNTLALANDLATDRCHLIKVQQEFSISGDEVILRKPCASDLALLMYTSGSTGQPHGVAHTHRSILAEISNLTNTWRIGSKDKLILLSSCAFASSIRTVFASLLNGATLVTYDLIGSGFTSLADTINTLGVTVLRSLPTTFRRYLRSIDPDTVFEDVRIVSLGGETVTPADINLFNRHFSPNSILVLSYGPTECLSACWGFCKHGVSCNESHVPMGFPRSNKPIVLVDENRQPVKHGEIGELIVTSDFLAQGYFLNPEASAARFVLNADGRRSFITGDIAVQRDDNAYVHLGRKDFQIKIRGYRVDILEIENAMRKMPKIQDAAVIAQQNTSGDNYLVAFYTLEGSNSTLDRESFYAFLRQSLPDFMIPAYYVSIDTFPVNENGKLDRKGFPLVQADVETCSTTQRSDPSELQQGILPQIEAYWRESLGTDNLPVDVNFVSLGGDSFKAIEIAFRIKCEIGMDVTPAQILKSKGIADLVNDMNTLTK